MALYTITASRSVTLGDTGEFLTAGAVGGVVHDPGYPLYTLFLHFVYNIPFLNSAFALNWTSALFGAITLVLVYKITYALTKNRAVSIFSSFAFGTYEFFWFYSQVVQVHIFHVFLLSFLYYFLVKLLITKNLKFLYLAGLTLGLGAVHSQTIIFAIPSFLLTLFYIRKSLSLKKLLTLTPFGFVGLLSYLYIPLASAREPLMNWGGVNTFQDLLFIMFRGHYGTFNLTAYSVDAPYSYSSFFFYFTSLIKTNWYILIPAVFSLLILKKHEKKYYLFITGFLLMGPFYYYLMDQRALTVTHLALMDQYIPYSFLFISIFAGVGAQQIFLKLKITNKSFLYLLLFPLVLYPLVTNFQKVRLDNNYLLENTTRFIFSELPRNSVILTGGDGLYFPGMYLQSIHKLRLDIAMVQLGQLSPWYEYQLQYHHPQLNGFVSNSKFDFKKACNELAASNLLYVYPWFVEFNDLFGDKCEVIPYGMVAKVVLKEKRPQLEQIKKFNDQEFNKFTKTVDYKQFLNSSTRTRQAFFDLAEHVNTRGLYYQKKGKNEWARQEYRLSANISQDESYALSNEAAFYFYNGDYKRSINLMKQAAKRAQLNPRVFYGLAFAYGKIGEEDKAYDNFIKYLEFEPVNDPQYKLILQFVKDYEAKKLQPKSTLTNF